MPEPFHLQGASRPLPGQHCNAGCGLAFPEVAFIQIDADEIVRVPSFQKRIDSAAGTPADREDPHIVRTEFPVRRLKAPRRGVLRRGRSCCEKSR